MKGRGKAGSLRSGSRIDISGGSSWQLAHHRLVTFPISAPTPVVVELSIGLSCVGVAGSSVVNALLVDCINEIM